MNKKSIIIVSLLIVITSVFIAADLLKSRDKLDNTLEDENSIVAIDIGQTAPDFTLVDLEGKSHNLSDFRGKVVMLNFWSLACPACLREMPDKDQLYLQYKDKGFEMITINLDRDIELVKNYLSNFEYSFKVLQGTPEVAGKYMVRFIPKTLFLDGDGVIRFQHVGSLSYGEMVEIIEEIGLPID
ncbi:TlpA family protein disulfide reductase [Anaerobranca gottschalkii]|uniref:Peroxiredoxin n=1 Tax=Anaerobranca gottschalkii DSM 13577 TaxID=1120990 RepID=A0A1H9YUT3_9FIRM|nr:TlpA disulfide reductase family protein [Anaerobranca gottschalkii]SES72943.1 Peroxiredoxin [Anaerobranca gottschalkii DSM 13577]